MPGFSPVFVREVVALPVSLPRLWIPVHNSRYLMTERPHCRLFRAALALKTGSKRYRTNCSVDF